MPKFFVPHENIAEDKITINNEDVAHITKVLRYKAGDELFLCDGRGTDYTVQIAQIEKKKIICNIISKKKSDTEPNIKITLFQGLPKASKMEYIIQKTTELGIAKIVPCIMDRCVVKLSDGIEKKVERWRKVAYEAAKQSGRGYVPEVTNFISFEECLGELKECDESFMCYEKGGVSLSKTGIAPVSEGEEKTIGLFIGCEGGFESHEAESCSQAGVTVVSLGPRILRCETAPLAALSVIMSLTGNM